MENATQLILIQVIQQGMRNLHYELKTHETLVK